MGVFSSLVSGLVKSLEDLSHWMWETTEDFLVWLGIDVGFDSVRGGLKWGIAKLPESWQHFMAVDAFPGQLWDLAEDINYFIPWKACLGVYLFALGLQGTIRLLRWVMGIEVLGFSVRG